MTGWIRLHRKTLDSAIFNNPQLLKMWVWCLLKATHTEYNLMVGLEEVYLKKGQFITGRNKGSIELNVNPSTWYKHLKLLESMKMIEINSNNKMTLVSIVNWELYQREDNKSNNQITTKEQPNNTNKNVKNVKKKDIHIDLFEYWISKDIIKHKELTNNMIKVIDNILKDYSVEIIKNGIKVYSEALHSDFYFNYRFTLEKFLKQNNGIVDWIEEGSMYENYKDYQKKSNPNTEIANNWRGTDKRL